MFDINVLTDVAVNREPFASESAAAIDYVIGGRALGHVAAHAVTTLFYLIAKRRGSVEAKVAVDFVLSYFTVVRVDGEILKAARELNGVDFEDDVVSCAAQHAGCGVIVTRDASGYAGSGIPAMLPADFISWLSESDSN